MHCTSGENVVTADYARPTGLIRCAVGAFVRNAHLRLTSEEVSDCLRQLEASDRVCIGVLCLTIRPPYSNPKDVKSLSTLLKRHMKIEQFSLHVFDLLDAHAAAHVVFKCFPRGASMASLEFVMKYGRQCDIKSTKSFLGGVVKKFERLQDAKMLPNWTRCEVCKTQRKYLRHHSFCPTLEERLRLPCGQRRTKFYGRDHLVSDTVHAFNDKLNRRLTVLIGYAADDYRGHATFMEFHVDRKPLCALDYPARPSNLVGDSLCDVFCFLERCDIDSCQLVRRSWHRNVRRLNWLLPLRSISFSIQSYNRPLVMTAESCVNLNSSQRYFDPRKIVDVTKNYDCVYLLMNAYVTGLYICTLRCQPKRMARAWRRAIETTNGSCVIELLYVKMVSAAVLGEVFTTLWEKATVRAFKLCDVHYHLSDVYYRRNWLLRPISIFRDRCIRFNKSIFHPLLLRAADLTICKPHPWKTHRGCESATSAGLSTANLLRLIMDGVAGRRRLIIHCPKWDFAEIFSTLIQDFSLAPFGTGTESAFQPN